MRERLIKVMQNEEMVEKEGAERRNIYTHECVFYMLYGNRRKTVFVSSYHQSLQDGSPFFFVLFRFSNIFSQRLM